MEASKSHLLRAKSSKVCVCVCVCVWRERERDGGRVEGHKLNRDYSHRKFPLFLPNMHLQDFYSEQGQVPPTSLPRPPQDSWGELRN